MCSIFLVFIVYIYMKNVKQRVLFKHVANISASAILGMDIYTTVRAWKG